MIRFVFRTPIGRVIETGVAIGQDLAEWAIYKACRRRLGVDALEERVHDAEVLVDGLLAEAEGRRRQAARFPMRAA